MEYLTDMIKNMSVNSLTTLALIMAIIFLSGMIVGKIGSVVAKLTKALMFSILLWGPITLTDLFVAIAKVIVESDYGLLRDVMKRFMMAPYYYDLVLRNSEAFDAPQMVAYLEIWVWWFVLVMAFLTVFRSMFGKSTALYVASFFGTTALLAMSGGLKGFISIHGYPWGYLVVGLMYLFSILIAHYKYKAPLSFRRGERLVVS